MHWLGKAALIGYIAEYEYFFFFFFRFERSKGFGFWVDSVLHIYRMVVQLPLRSSGPLHIRSSARLFAPSRLAHVNRSFHFSPIRQQQQQQQKQKPLLGTTNIPCLKIFA